MLLSCILFLVLISGSFANYSDPYPTRQVFYPAAAAAYSDTPQQCLNRVGSFIFRRRYEVNCDSDGNTCSGYTAVSLTDKAIMIVFRGTNANEQLWTESVATIKNQTLWVNGGKVGGYYMNGFIKIWNSGMKDDFLSLKNQYPTYQLWITGHSLGGAMAALATSYIATNSLFPTNQITAITFGEPRVGDLTFAQKLDQAVPNYYRVTHSHDLIPHLPSEGHYGYEQHKTEVYYPGSMAPGSPYTVCSQDEDKSCSDGNSINLSFDDHMTYFEVNIMHYGRGGCQQNI